MPAFSRVMAAMVEPSHSVWSSEISVITESSGSTTLVASSRPPIPTSSTAISAPLLGKIQKSLRGQNFKVAGQLRQATVEHQLVGCIVNAKEECGEGVVVDLDAVKADALVGALQMRRGIEAGAHSGGGKNRGQRGSRRAFAVGSGDQHRGKAAVRIAECTQQNANLVEREFAPGLAGARVELRHHCIQLIDGCGIRHGKFSIEERGIGTKAPASHEWRLLTSAGATAMRGGRFAGKHGLHLLRAGPDGRLFCRYRLPGWRRGKVRIDAGEKQIVVHLVEKVAQGGGVAIAGADQAGERGGELLLDGLFEHRTAHDGAGGKETKEIAARGLVEIAVGLLGAGRGHNAFAQVGGAEDGRLDQLQQLQGKGGAQQIVLLAVEGALNLLPGGSGYAVHRLAAAG